MMLGKKNIFCIKIEKKFQINKKMILDYTLIIIDDLLTWLARFRDFSGMVRRLESAKSL